VIPPEAQEEIIEHTDISNARWVRQSIEYSALVDLSKKSPKVKAFVCEGRSCDTCDIKESDATLFEDEETCTHADCFERRLLTFARESGTPLVCSYLSSNEKERLSGIKIINEYPASAPSEFRSKEAIDKDGNVCFICEVKEMVDTSEVDKEKAKTLRQQRKAFREDHSVLVGEMARLGVAFRTLLETAEADFIQVVGDPSVAHEMLRNAFAGYVIAEHGKEILELYYPEFDSKTQLSDAVYQRYGSDPDKALSVGSLFCLNWLHHSKLFGAIGNPDVPGAPLFPCERFERWITKAEELLDNSQWHINRILVACRDMLQHQDELGNVIPVHESLGALLKSAKRTE